MKLIDEIIALTHVAATEVGSAAVSGRNDTLIGRYEDGATFFAKKFTGPGSDARFRRSIAAAEAASPLRTPQVLKAYPKQRIILFELLQGSDAQRIDLHEVPSAAWLTAAGRTLGTLHALSPAAASAATRQVINLDAISSLSFSQWHNATAGELELLALLHRDRELVSSLEALASAPLQTDADTVFVHGDLRIDQFVGSAENLWLLDFEEAGWGDAARDIASLMGDHLHRVLISLPARRLQDAMYHAETGVRDEDIVARGSEDLEAASRAIQLMLFAYCEARTIEALPRDFLIRVVSLAGWHMYDRAFAVAKTSSKLPAPFLAAAGVGRVLLLNPSLAIEQMGLTNE